MVPSCTVSYLLHLSINYRSLWQISVTMWCDISQLSVTPRVGEDIFSEAHPYSPECVEGKFLELRLNGVLRSSHIRPSAKSINLNTCNYLIIADDIGSPSGIPGLSGWGYAGVLRPYIVVLLVCLLAKSPREEEGRTLWVTTPRRRTTMNRTGLWAACVVLILLVVGAAALTTVGAGYAKDEDTSKAKCSKATLDGTYLFAQNGVEIKGNDQRPFALAGYDVFDGNGKVRGVSSGNFGGEGFRKDPFTGTYTVKANCTGTVTFKDGAATQGDVFVAPDGSMFAFVRTNPED